MCHCDIDLVHYDGGNQAYLPHRITNKKRWTHRIYLYRYVTRYKVNDADSFTPKIYAI